MSGVRATMTMRATVRRNATTTEDTWGQPDAADYKEVAIVPCRVWSKARRHADDAGKDAVIEDLRANVPTTADVREDDRLGPIVDRDGIVQFAGPLIVETRTRRGSFGARASHFELMLRRHK